MTVPATTRRAGPFTGNGSAVAFPFTFKVFSQDDIQVVLADANAVEVVQALTTHYTVAVNADQDASPGGTVTMLTAPADGETLAITGAVDYEQTLDLPSGGNFSPRAVENAFDRTVIQIQQLAEQLGRSLTLPATAAGADTELPPPEAGKVIAWNAAGTGLTNLDAEDIATVAATANAYCDIFDGAAASYQLTRNPGSVNNLRVAVSGVLQTPGVDYTVSGSTLIPTTPWPAGTDTVVAVYSPVVEQVSLGYLAEAQTLTAGQSTITLTTMSYTPGVNGVHLYVDGLRVTDFTETSSTTLTLGFTAAGGEEAYVLAGRLISGGTAAESVSYQVNAGAANTLSSRLARRIYVTDYDGVDPTGQTDSSSGVQAAINAAQAYAALYTERGAAVYFPAGLYRIDTPLTVTAARIALIGDGASHSVLFTSSSTAAAILKAEAASSASLAEFALQGLKFEGRASNITGGRLVELTNIVGGWFSDLKIDNWYDGIYFRGGNRCFFNRVILSDNGRLAGKGRYAVVLVGSSATGYASDVHFADCQILANTASASINHEAAMLLRGFDGVYITNSHFYQGDYGLLVSPMATSGENFAASLLVSNTYLDTTEVGAHVYFQGQATTYNNFQFANVYFRESANDGVHFASLSSVPKLLTFSGCQFRTNGGSGIKVDETTNPPTDMVVSGCLFDNNNTDGGASDGDLLLRGSRILVASSSFSTGNAAGAAVDLRAEASDCVVADCDFRASTAGTKYRDAGSGNKRRGLEGFALRTEGTATITNPATSEVVTHGLAVTPSAQDINLVLTSASAGVTRWWVSSITSTQFTINVDTTPSASASFAWKADTQD